MKCCKLCTHIVCPNLSILCLQVILQYNLVLAKLAELANIKKITNLSATNKMFKHFMEGCPNDQGQKRLSLIFH